MCECKNNEPRQGWRIQKASRFDHHQNIRSGTTEYNGKTYNGEFADAILVEPHPSDGECFGKIIRGIFMFSAADRKVLAPEPPLEGTDGAEISSLEEQSEELFAIALRNEKL